MKQQVREAVLSNECFGREFMEYLETFYFGVDSRFPPRTWMSAYFVGTPLFKHTRTTSPQESIWSVVKEEEIDTKQTIGVATGSLCNFLEKHANKLNKKILQIQNTNKGLGKGTASTLQLTKLFGKKQKEKRLIHIKNQQNQLNKKYPFENKQNKNSRKKQN